MLDIKLVRENPEIIEQDLNKRGAVDKIGELHELIIKDKERRHIIQKVEDLKCKRNKITKIIADKKKKNLEVSREMKEMKDIPDEIKELDKRLDKLNSECKNMLMRLPNILHDSVPIGKDDNDNIEVKRWGLVPEFRFKPKNHLEILQGLNLIDSERAAKISGHGFFYMKNELVLLDHAIQRFAIDFLMKKGFLLVQPPYMMNRKPYEGVTDLAAFQDVLYKIEGEDLYMIATSEHPMAAMHMDEVFEKKELPLKFMGISPCFRKEVGAHGKYTKGLFRMHHFNKIEQFVFCLPDQSWQFHEEIQCNSEELYKALEIPYRVVNVCTGDIGDIAAKKYDIESWMADGHYREIGSNSNCTDYQARRLNIKWRDVEGKAPEGFVHTLNNTALATSRAMVAIIENGQQEDGSIKIPKALWPYTGFKEISRR
ncbi:MAG: serine--tRNA ligase [Candidatus Aenigmarchaeota archaeon]|nr:serine--tRNA ligase [Candidatus Aenigmarchaeota archaeon]